ncbi:MAG: hypothetical protein K2F99_06460 [Muribaculaceae bacterium]|nr:hypothetical protein [Muribaculaceae bacterium]
MLMKINAFITLLGILAVFGFQNSTAQSFEPKWIGSASALICEEDTASVPLEVANIQIKTSNSAGRLLVGIGNTRQKVVIKGGQSPVQLASGQPVTLIVRCKDNQQDPRTFIQVVKFEEKKKERKTELANINWLGNVTEGDIKYVPYEADMYGKSSYILTFPPEDGEYGVRILNPDEKDEKAPVFMCFGVH